MQRDNITATLHTAERVTGGLSPRERLSGLLSVGGGVSSYNELEDLPTVNGHEFIGNMTSEDLGIWQPKDFSTTEQNTGIKWIDGKDIFVKSYQTTINNTSLKYIDNVYKNTNIHMLPLSTVSIDTKGTSNTTFLTNLYTDNIVRLLCNSTGVAVSCPNYQNSYGTSDIFVVLYFTKIL